MSQRSIQIFNPRKSKRRSPKSNPGVLTFMANPKRKSKRSGARSHKHHNNPHHASHRRSHRRNYSTKITRRRHNPHRVAGSVGLNTPKDWLYLGAGAAVGALGPGYLGNMFLGANNQGALGYLVESALSIVGGILVAKFFNRAAG